MKSFALIASVSAIRVNDISDIHAQNYVEPSRPHHSEIYSAELHWNEDPHSVPSPLRGAPYLTSTQARFIAENSTANAVSNEPKGSQWWHFNYGPYNADATEYVQLPLEDDTMVLT